MKTLEAAALRAVELSSPALCLFLVIVPGGVSVCGRQGEHRRSLQKAWAEIEAGEAVAPLVDDVRRALMVAK